jgi:hypothetical protein
VSHPSGPPPAGRLSPRHWLLVDIVCAVPVAYVDTPSGGAFPRDGALPLWGALLFVAATATAVAIRRVRPLTALALAAGAALLAVALGCPKTPFLGLALVVYIVAVAATDRIRRPAWRSPKPPWRPVPHYPCTAAARGGPRPRAR